MGCWRLKKVWRSVIFLPPSDHAGPNPTASVPLAFQLIPVAWQGPTWVLIGLAWPIVVCHLAEEDSTRESSPPPFLHLIPEALLRSIAHLSIILDPQTNDLGFFRLVLLPRHLLDISSPFDLAWGLIRRSPSPIFVLHGGKVVVATFQGCSTSSLALQHWGRVAFPPILVFGLTNCIYHSAGRWPPPPDHPSQGPRSSRPHRSLQEAIHGRWDCS